MHVVFMGPPGSGKGTQAVRLAQHLGVPHLSTGDMLRENKRIGTPLGKEAANYMDAGNLVPDELVLEMLTERILQDDCRGGVLLDGFPRTVAQAEALDKHLQAVDRQVDLVIELEVPHEELLRRLTGRAEQDGRVDDTPETIKRRLGVYQDLTTPLRGYYSTQGRLAEIDGIGSVDQVFDRIRASLPEGAQR